MLKLYLTLLLFVLTACAALTGDTPSSADMKSTDIVAHPPAAANPNAPAPADETPAQSTMETPDGSTKASAEKAPAKKAPVEKAPAAAQAPAQTPPSGTEKKQPMGEKSNVKEAAPEMKNPLVKIASEDEFCFFLPPQPNVEVAPSEDWGVSYCTSESVIKGNKVFPEGFITKTHYFKNSRYTQVTGYMEPGKFGLIPTDEGGQYDNHHKGKPIGAQCKGYNYFVNLLEPADSRFCIRCCNYKEDCNTGISQYGCIRVIDGDYSYEELVNEVFQTIVAQEHHMARVSPSLQEQVNTLLDLSKQPSTTPKQMKQEWGMFADRLAQAYPSEQHGIHRASQTTEWFKQTSQWWYFLSNLVLQVHQDEQDTQ